MTSRKNTSSTSHKPAASKPARRPLAQQQTPSLSAGEARRLRLPAEPRFTWQGKRRSTAFTRGVQYAQQLIQSVQDSQDTADDDGRAAIVQVALIMAVRRAPTDYADGAAAAVGIWLAIARHSEADAHWWTPMAPPLLVRKDREFPPADHRFFQIGDDAISVGQAHDAYRWTRDTGHDSDVANLFGCKALLQPISRRRFNQLRARKEA